MGPRDKRAAGAAVTLAIILSQMVSGQCLPGRHFKLPSGSCTKNVKSSNNMLMKKRASHNNFLFNNHSKAINFPDVAYPSDFEPEKYYRFLSEYPIQYKPNNDSNGRKSKMETTHKRKCNSNLNPTATNSFKDCDAVSQPYCFRRSNFFPEVEYPLSSRDMWAPKYWSRLQDANIHDDMETEGPVYRSATEETADKTYYFDYNTSDINTLKEMLNTKNTQITGTRDNDITLQPDVPKEDKFVEIASNGTSSIRKDNNYQQSSILNQSSLGEISTTTFNLILSNYEMNETSRKDALLTEPSATTSTISDSNPVAKTDNPLESESISNMINTINTGIPDKQITSTPETSSNISSGFEISHIKKQINDPLAIIIATTESSLTTILPPLSSDATIPSIQNSNSDNLNILRQTTSTPSLLPESIIPSDLEIKNINLSGLVDTTLTEPVVIETATTESIPITNMFTPSDYHETIPTTWRESSYSDITDTTAVPFLGITSPISSPILLIPDIELDPPEDMISMTPTLGSITSAQTNFSSDSLSVINSQPSLLSNDNDYCLIVADDNLQIFSYTDAENFATEWMLNCNDSYIISDPENSEEWVIYVDSENPLLPQGDSSDKLTDTWDYFTLENSATDEVVNSTLLIRHGLAEGKDKSMKETTSILDNIENSNITSSNQSNFTDTPAMVTTVPDSQDYAFEVIYEIENTTEGVALNEYEYIMTGVDNSDFNKTLDTMLVSSDSNSSTLQYDYIDDSLTLYTNTP